MYIFVWLFWIFLLTWKRSNILIDRNIAWNKFTPEVFLNNKTKCYNMEGKSQPIYLLCFESQFFLSVLKNWLERVIPNSHCFDNRKSSFLRKETQWQKSFEEKISTYVLPTFRIMITNFIQLRFQILKKKNSKCGNLFKFNGKDCKEVSKMLASVYKEFLSLIFELCYYR